MGKHEAPGRVKRQINKPTVKTVGKLAKGGLHQGQHVIHLITLHVVALTIIGIGEKAHIFAFLIG